MQGSDLVECLMNYLTPDSPPWLPATVARPAALGSKSMRRARSEASDEAELSTQTRMRGEQGESAAAADESSRATATTVGGEIFKRFALDQTRRFGQGTYGVTFAASDTQDGGRACAVKVINTTKIRARDAIERCRTECSILETLSHHNVIKVLGHGTGQPSSGQGHLYFIFMELASGGELFDQVISSNALIEVEVRGFTKQILAGVEHCHARGVAHRDLKLENMLCAAPRGSHERPRRPPAPQPGVTPGAWYAG